MASEFFVVFMTASNDEEAARIADALVTEGLAACVNIVPGCRSVYKWKGKVERDDEVLVIAKTSRANFARLESRITRLHSYDVPEIIGVELECVSGGYAEFLRENLAEDD